LEASKTQWDGRELLHRELAPAGPCSLPRRRALPAAGERGISLLASRLLLRHRTGYGRGGARLNGKSCRGRNRTNRACAARCQQRVFDQKKGATWDVVSLTASLVKGLVAGGLSVCMGFRQKYGMPSTFKDLFLKFGRNPAPLPSTDRHSSRSLAPALCRGGWGGRQHRRRGDGSGRHHTGKTRICISQAIIFLQ